MPVHDVRVDDAPPCAIRKWGRGPVTWIGLSMGAMVGMGFAIRHPDPVLILVLANTTSRYPDAAAANWAQSNAAVHEQVMVAVATSARRPR